MSVLIRIGKITFCSMNILVAKLIELFGHLDGPQFLEAGKAGAFSQDQMKK